jgi:hypothetical protein
MLSEFSRKAKRATVLTGTVAAAALLMGAGAANALLIDNFGGRHVGDSGGISHTDLGSDGLVGGSGAAADTKIGFASVTAFTQGGSVAGFGTFAKSGATDDPGGASEDEFTTPCAGQGAGGGDHAWCIGGGITGARILTINARNDTSLTSSINLTNGATGRPDGAFRATDSAGGNDDSFGEATLTYGRSNVAGDGVIALSPKMDLLVKENVDSRIYGSDPDGAGYLTHGATTLASFGVDGTNGTADDGTDAEKAAEIGMWGFILDALNIDKATTELDITLTSDDAVDLGYGATTSHTLVFELPFVSADPLGQEVFVPFLDFIKMGEDSEATRLALITALQGVRLLQFQFGGPEGIFQNQLSFDSIRTGMQNLPEPGTLAVMGMGLIGLGIARRRRKQAA